MKKLYLLFISLVICLSFYSLTYAQVIADKREMKLTIEPGQKFSDTITVENTSNKDITVKAYLEDVGYESPYNELKCCSPLGSTSYSSGKWVSITPDLFIIPKKAKQTITYNVNVPNNAKGGYYNILFLEVTPNTAVGDKGISLVTRSGFPFFLETKDKKRSGKIEDISIAQDSIKGYLINSGNVILITQGTFYIMDEKGIVSDRGDIAKFYLPPEAKAPFTIKLSNQITKGKYTVVINFDLEEGKTLVKEVDFSKDASGEIKILKVRD